MGDDMKHQEGLMTEEKEDCGTGGGGALKCRLGRLPRRRR
jgi:hypothetical protein